MTSKLISFATLLVLLAGGGLARSTSAASADSAAVGVVAAIDVPAAQFWATQQDVVRSGGKATRIELDDIGIDTAMSPWYWLAYLDGGTRLQVFEHSAAATTDPQTDIGQSENMAWRLANEAIGPISGPPASDQLPHWARVRTSNATGPSAGLMFTLAYIDALTPGTLVGNLRVAGTGAIGADGVVIPVAQVDIKVAAALLTQPDVIFTPTAPTTTKHVTVVESQHTRSPDVGYTIGQWLNVSGYEQAGRDAASDPRAIAIVVVHDLRQVLAWLCGRTDNTTTCAAAHLMATIPIGTAT